MRAAVAVAGALWLAGCGLLGGKPAGPAPPPGPAAAPPAPPAPAAPTAAPPGGAPAPAVTAAPPADGRAAAAGALLRQADEQLLASQYRSALALYDEFLKAHPDDPATPRARATRSAVARLLAAQAEIERLRLEVGTRQREIERLKADLERLRRIDLRPAPPR